MSYFHLFSTTPKNLGCLLGTYLGTPIFMHRRNVQSYQYLIDKIHWHIEGWQSKFLSIVGRATLIKFTTSAISIYAMQTTIIPQKIYKDIDRGWIKIFYVEILAIIRAVIPLVRIWLLGLKKKDVQILKEIVCNPVHMHDTFWKQSQLHTHTHTHTYICILIMN